MPTDLLTELTHEAADSSRRRARYVKAFITSLESEGPGGDRRSIELTIQEVVADTARRGVDGGRLWVSLFELLRNRSTRSSLIKLIVEEVIELADEWLGLEAQIRKLVELGRRTGFTLDESAVRDLDDSTRVIAKLKTEATLILAGLNRSRPDIDAARLAEGRKAIAEGRGMKSEDVIAAVKAARK